MQLRSVINSVITPLINVSACVGALLAVSAGPAHAEWINRTEDVPVARLVTNLEARIAKNPRDAQAHYVLARVHSMAWAHETETIEIEPPETDAALPTFAPWQSVQRAREVAVSAPSETAKRHFHRSVSSYRKAAKLDGKASIHFMGLGYMLQDGARYVQWLRTPDGSETKTSLSDEEIARHQALVARLTAETKGDREVARRKLIAALPAAATVLRWHLRTEDADERAAVIELLRYHWVDLAAAAYRTAHTIALPSDLVQEAHGETGDEPLSQESGAALLAILRTRETSKSIEQEIATLEVVLKKLKALPRWETPIVFPLSGQRPLVDLIHPTRRVDFDLDGDGVAGRWPWVRSDVGILVWDLDGDGIVSSGRDLFGGRTWWIRWPDGYAPLAALDDNADGRLAGDELRGLGVWVDRNGNAISDAGEVQPVTELLIAAISVRSDHEHDGVPATVRGITFSDGATVPTYEWTPQRAASATEKPLRERLAE